MQLLIDPLIKTHVLLPITLIMLLVHLLRAQITKWAISSDSPLVSNAKVREDHHLNRLRIQSIGIGVGNTSLCQSEFQARKLALEAQYSGDKLSSQVLNSEPDPDSMLDKLKPQMIMMLLQYIPQPVLLWFTSTFFSGYVVVKLPFHLTSNFKEMLHNSITTPDLNVEYVTAISWFFVNLVGIESLADVSIMLLTFLGKSIGLISSSYLDSAPTEMLLLTNLQNVDNILSVGGMSTIPSQAPIQTPFPGMVQPKREDVFQGIVKSMKNVQYNSVLDGIQGRFISKYH